MVVLFFAFLGGVVGAVLMDITDIYAHKFGISSGVTVAQIGRWVLCMGDGVLVHEDIRNTRSRKNEIKTGWVFHFVVGGGLVGLCYPLIFMLTSISMPQNHLLTGLLFGLATSLLPWLILLPSFGWGWFGLRAPKGANPLLASTISHAAYGIGLGLVMNLALNGRLF